MNVFQAYSVRMKDLMNIAEEKRVMNPRTLRGAEALPLPSDRARGSSTPKLDKTDLVPASEL